jgi:hypothetical protein
MRTCEVLLTRSLWGVFLLASVFVCSAERASAALLYFDPGAVEINRGDSVTLGLRIDTDEEECINTVDAIVHYDPSIRLTDVSRGSSILNLWVENPVIDEVNHTVTFAGGIPGGYCGRIPGDPSLTNVILELVFKSPGLNIGSDGGESARIWVDESAQVLLHDGLGTNAQLRLQDAHITLLKNAGTSITDEWRQDILADDDLPSDFAITLSKSDTAFSGDYFITFNAIDKQSGMDHYEVMEEPITEFHAFTWGGADVPWVTTESPYVLTDQTLNSTIRVKAVDKAGNERIVVLVPDPALQSMSRDERIVWGLFGGVFILLIALVTYAVLKRRNAKRSEIIHHEEIL